jgi:hypothetical protein
VAPVAYFTEAGGLCGETAGAWASPLEACGGGAMVTKRGAPHGESPVSRASLVEAYIAALPFAPAAVVAIPGDGCRIAVGGEIAPGETIAQQYYFKASHIELVLSAAGLTDSPVPQSPDAVVALLEKAARAMRAPYETAAEIRAAAELEVDKIVAKVEATNASGGLRELNRSYKAYRQQQIAKAERAVPYSKFLEERYTLGIIRSVASVGRMI